MQLKIRRKRKIISIKNKNIITISISNKSLYLVISQQLSVEFNVMHAILTTTEIRKIIINYDKCTDQELIFKFYKNKLGVRSLGCV